MCLDVVDVQPEVEFCPIYKMATVGLRISLRNLKPQTTLQLFRLKSSQVSFSNSDNNGTLSNEIIFTEEHTQLRASLRKVRK